MEALAKIRHLKGSPRKARLVIDLIRGRNVSQALAILKFTDKRAADPIAKTLRSAIANATFQAEKQNIAIDPDDLFVKTCFVDMGAHKNRRRMRPAPQGRAFREQRHYCHITIMVSSDLPEAKDDDKSKKKARLAAGKKTDGGDRKSQTSVNPKASKKAAKANGIKEEEITVTAEVPTAKVKETKKAKAEKSPIEEAVETKETKVETPVPIIEEAVKPQAVETEEPKAGETAETQTTNGEKTGGAETTDVIEVESSKENKETKDSKAAKKDAKGDAEASDAKNVVSQTPAERNETKKADEAQLNDNDILESQ
ncbi:MAG: 50S ribosomal protein L22 [Acidobacteria bacterium]|nr:50S ribosomal protein L22 [Acidobacteriota bacterium]